MLVRIPGNDNRFYQTNQGEISGNIWASYNLDLTSNPGSIRVSPQTEMLFSNLDSTAIVYPVAVVAGDFDGVQQRYWVVGDDAIVKTSNVGSNGVPSPDTWEQDLITDTPTSLNHFYSDAVEWDGSLIVSGVGAGDLAKLTEGTWDASWWKTTLGKSSLNMTIGVPLGKGFNNLLLIGNGNVVASVDIYSTVKPTRLTFAAEYNVIWIRSSSSMIYFGCRNKNGGRAKVFTWDGYSENFNQDYKINGSECFAGVIKDEICYTINERGELLAFNGGGFTQIAVLPVFNYDYNLSSNWALPRNIGRNGMAVQDNRIHILIQAAVGGDTSTQLENQLSGIWVYDPELGLHHKYSITKTKATTGVVDYGSPIIQRSGFLFPISKENGNLLIGCSLWLANGITPNTIRHAILSIKNNESDASAKVGYFITPKIRASEVEENWQKIYVLIKKLLDSTDKIYVKYRTDYKYFGDLDVSSSPAPNATWVNTTSFTADYDLTDTSVGDEIEILTGEGSGLSANIVSINDTLVVIDETVAGASGTIKVRASNWKKVGTDIATQGLRNFELPLDVRSSWIQIKCVFFFKGKEELERIIIKSEKQLSV